MANKTIKHKNNQYVLTLSKRKKRANSLKVIKGGSIEVQKIAQQVEKIIKKMIPDNLQGGQIIPITDEIMKEINSTVAEVKKEIKSQTGIDLNGILVRNILNAVKNIALTVSTLGPVDDEFKKFMDEIKNKTGCSVTTAEIKGIASELFSLILLKEMKKEVVNTNVIDKLNIVLTREGCKNIVKDLKNALKNISTQQMSKTLNLGNDTSTVKAKMKNLSNIKPISDKSQKSTQNVKKISDIIASNPAPIVPNVKSETPEKMEQEIEEIKQNPESEKQALIDEKQTVDEDGNVSSSPDDTVVKEEMTKMDDKVTSDVVVDKIENGEYEE